MSSGHHPHDNGQSLATLLCGTDFRNIGLRLPIIELGDIFISYSRLLAFGTALIGAVALYLFLSRTYLGIAMRAIAQDREIMGLMGVDQRRIYLITSAVGGALAGLAACLLVLQYDVHPFIGLSFGPITFMICVLGGLGNMIGGFVAAFVMSQIIGGESNRPPVKADWRVAQNPFAGAADPILLVAALVPDVALFHARWADEAGNVWVGRRRELATLAHAARHTYVTVEEFRAGDMLDDELLAPGVISALATEFPSSCELFAIVPTLSR